MDTVKIGIKFNLLYWSKVNSIVFICMIQLWFICTESIILATDCMYVTWITSA